MEKAKSQSLEEDFEGQASHTGKQSQKKKTIVNLKLNLEISYCHYSVWNLSNTFEWVDGII